MAKRKIKRGKISRRVSTSRRGKTRHLVSNKRNRRVKKAPKRRRVSSRGVVRKASPSPVKPVFSKVLLKTSDITERGFSRTLVRNGLARTIKKGLFVPGPKLDISSTGLSPKKRRGLVLSFQTSIQYKDKRGRVHRDIAPGVIVHPSKYYEDTKKGFPKALLSSFLFALDRNGLRGDYTAYFRKRVGQVLKPSERPKAREIKVEVSIQGYEARTQELNLSRRAKKRRTMKKRGGKR